MRRFLRPKATVLNPEDFMAEEVVIEIKTLGNLCAIPSSTYSVTLNDTHLLSTLRNCINVRGDCNSKGLSQKGIGGYKRFSLSRKGSSLKAQTAQPLLATYGQQRGKGRGGFFSSVQRGSQVRDGHPLPWKDLLCFCVTLLCAFVTLR